MPTPPLSDPWLPAPVSGAIARNMPGIVTRVTRRSQSSPGVAPTFAVLDNVTWTSIARKLGPDPGVCMLRYALGNGDADAPQNFEECLSDAVSKAKTIEPDDRIVVWATRPDGVEVPLFDGFALTFDGHLAARSEGVEITCVGVAYRLWDSPIRGATYRHGSDPLGPGANAEVDFEPHFNPKGRGNCSPEGTDGDAWANQDADGDQRYPVFYDADGTQEGGKAPVSWTLANAGRYLIFRHNKGDFVASPDGGTVDDVLVARLPKDGFKFDYDDEATFDRAGITVADKPIAGKDWPNTLHGLISDKGFEFAFDIDRLDVGGDPATPDTHTSLRLLLPQAEPAKPLYLQGRGQYLDLNYSNLGGASVGRDLSQVVNTWHVEGDLEIVEASFVLHCAFPSVATDASAVGLYDRTAANFAAVRDRYRTWILDESGEGHYAPNGETLSTTAADLDAVLGAPVGGKPKYAKRRRPPLGELVKTAAGRPLRAQLHISTDYSGPGPGVWTAGAANSGTWQPVASGWELLPDRIGIYVNCKNPNAWEIGKPDVAANMPFQDGVVKAVECLARNAAPNKKFWLRLTVAFRGDARVRGTAARPLGAVIRRPIARVVNANDRYQKRRIVRKSANNAGADDLVVRDDTANAAAEATALQIATLNGVTGGVVTIPWITDHYRLGDRISHIEGRALGFRADKDGPDAEPVYPVVTAIRYDNDRGVQTVLELSDANAGRHTLLRQIRRRTAPRNA